MINPTEIKAVCDWMIAKYPKLGQVAADELQKWRAGKVPYAYPEILDRHLEQAHREILDPSLGEKRRKLLFDAFYQVLPFGTGGRRGPVGYGSNRLNPTTVAMTIQGHSDYLRKTFPDRKELTVVVANDVRVFKDIANTYNFLDANHPLIGMSSRSFGMLACSIYAANGIVAYFAEPQSPGAVLATPELSFLIKQLHALGGINMSASHNPPDDNGVKVYDEYGSQPVAPNDQTLVEAMRDVKVREMPFADALKKGLVRPIPAGLHQQYIQAYVEKYHHLYDPWPDVPIVYTPLCGCGLTTVGEVLTKIGFPWKLPPNQEPDGTFKSIPFKAPNPEVPEATGPAKAFADSIGAGVVLSSDPDADRVGLEAKLKDGAWYHFDGNQIGAILCYFLMLDPQGPRRRGLVIETLVTTRLLGEIVKRSPGSKIIDDLLVGFKYVADVLKSLELTGKFARPGGESVVASPDDLVLAAEESHGVIVVPSIRDKDATPACLYLAALYQRLHQEGKTLLDYYLQMLNELGGYDSAMRSITMFGADGMTQIARIMKSLRTDPPKELEGQRVHPDIMDFWNEEKFGKFKSETDRLPRNVFQFTTDNCSITIRPSGTEPKIKLYCQLLPDREPSKLRGLELLRSLRERSEMLTRSIYGNLLERAGLPRLGQAALLLPDIVSFERKDNFQKTTVPQLQEGLKTGRWSNLADLHVWLREQTAQMTPGADPLPALKAPVAYLCREWSSGQSPTPVFSQLLAWAKS
jgi:phosphoglucomutase/phosphomannomutase